MSKRRKSAKEGRAKAREPRRLEVIDRLLLTEPRALFLVIHEGLSIAAATDPTMESNIRRAMRAIEESDEEARDVPSNRYYGMMQELIADSEWSNDPGAYVEIREGTELRYDYNTQDFENMPSWDIVFVGDDGPRVVARFDNQEDAEGALARYQARTTSRISRIVMDLFKSAKKKPSLLDVQQFLKLVLGVDFEDVEIAMAISLNGLLQTEVWGSQYVLRSAWVLAPYLGREEVEQALIAYNEIWVPVQYQRSDVKLINRAIHEVDDEVKSVFGRKPPLPDSLSGYLPFWVRHKAVETFWQKIGKRSLL